MLGTFAWCVSLCEQDAQSQGLTELSACSAYAFQQTLELTSHEKLQPWESNLQGCPTIQLGWKETHVDVSHSAGYALLQVSQAR